MDGTIFKILSEPEWRSAEAAGEFAGSAVDLTDGYIHFSTAEQLRETAAKHFAGKPDLVLLHVDTARLDPERLRWEPSRGGALFPHLYARLPVASVTRVDRLPADGAGHRFPDDLDV